MADGNESNWWPGGSEPNRRPGEYADPRTSGSRGGQPPWDQPAPPNWEQPVQPPWDQPPVQPPRERPVQPPWDQPVQRPQDRRPQDRRPQDWHPQDQGQRPRNPRQDPDEWDWMPDGGPDGRPRQLPRTTAERMPYPGAPGGPGGPGGRHRGGPPDAGAGRGRSDDPRSEDPRFDDARFDDERPEERRGLGRTVTFVGGGLIVAVVLVAFALGFSRGGGTGAASSAPTPTEAVQPNTPAAQSGPGAPTVTAHSLSGQQVEFSWSYANPAAGDTFRVTNNGGQPTTVNKPDLVLTVAQGQKACVQVQVVSASGTDSAESDKVCYPPS
jgi:hypothetical protein